MEPPARPLVFCKFTTSVIGDGEQIRIPARLTERVDWEVELAVVIDTRAPRKSREDALSDVRGYTVANDVSARDLQFADVQWMRAQEPGHLLPARLGARRRSTTRRTCGVTTVNGEIVQDSTPPR